MPFQAPAADTMDVVEVVFCGCVNKCWPPLTRARMQFSPPPLPHGPSPAAIRMEVVAMVLAGV